MPHLVTDRGRQDMPVYAGMAAVAENFDGYILDLWGVLHDGERAFPWALDCLARLRSHGKGLVILSNAPRRAAAVAGRCAELGLGPDSYDLLMSSGEDAWRHLSERPDAWYRALGTRCYHLGPPRDHGMRDGLDYRFVDDLDAADFLLNTGALSSADTPERYRDLLSAAAGRELPMVCANPDHVVVRGGAREICAGAIARLYEQMGGEVRYHGKPHAGVYRTCLELFDGLPASRVLAVGDSLHTDVLGAQGIGLEALFVASGIHAEAVRDPATGEVDPARLQTLCAVEGVHPLGAVPAFRW